MSLNEAWREAADREQTLDTEAREAVRRDLESRIRAWASSEDGLQKLRTELMDSVDRGLVHRAFLRLAPELRTVRERVPEIPRSDAEIRRFIAASELRMSVIRAWAGRWYGDRAPGDWFETYCKAAAMREESVVRDLERLSGDAQTSTRNNLDAAMRGVNASLRLRLVQAPPGVKIGHLGLRSRLRLLLPFGGRTRDVYTVEDHS
ncbi:MAG: hypothetical protein ACRES9_08880 [Gammaproteobacteria bacterium]